MFLIDLQYEGPLAEIDASLADHVTFLREQYERGIFLVSGRKVPRTGGIILARGISREELDVLLEKDPFKARRLARYNVTEFVAGMTAADLAMLREG